MRPAHFHPSILSFWDQRTGLIQVNVFIQIRLKEALSQKIYFSDFCHVSKRWALALLQFPNVCACDTGLLWQLLIVNSFESKDLSLFCRAPCTIQSFRSGQSEWKTLVNQNGSISHSFGTALHNTQGIGVKPFDWAIPGDPLQLFWPLATGVTWSAIQAVTPHTSHSRIREGKDEFYATFVHFPLTLAGCFSSITQDILKVDGFPFLINH